MPFPASQAVGWVIQPKAPPSLACASLLTSSKAGVVAHLLLEAVLTAGRGARELLVSRPVWWSRRCPALPPWAEEEGASGKAQTSSARNHFPLLSLPPSITLPSLRLLQLPRGFQITHGPALAHPAPSSLLSLPSASAPAMASSHFLPLPISSPPQVPEYRFLAV